METPYWLLEERLLKKNLELLEYITRENQDVKILLALTGVCSMAEFRFGIYTHL